MYKLLYLGYYLKELSWAKVKRFEQHALLHAHTTRVGLWWDVLTSVWKYNISILDYFYFRFYLNETDRASFAGTGFMYEYQRIMNPHPHRQVLSDKLKFIETFKPFIKRKVASVEELKKNPELLAGWWSDGSTRLVIKYSKGQVGAEVKVVEKKAFTTSSFLKYLTSSHFNLVEEFVEQHPDLMKLSPSGLNTVRIVTQWHKDQVHILAARLRITINSEVDNMAAGNLAAPIDLETGRVSGPGVYSDITKSDQVSHPVTKVKIMDFQIPHWLHVLELVKKAALVYPANRSVGWDVSISENDVQLIEGNHNWCKLLWQLPVKTGLKRELQSFI